MPKMDSNFAGRTPTAKRGMHWLAIGGTAVARLIVIVAALALFDPFGWHTLARLTGRYDATADAIPADTLVYVGANLLNANLDKMQQLRNTFATALQGTAADPETLSQEIETSLMSDLGLTFAEDVQPWLGQYLGLAVLQINIGEAGQPDSLLWVVVAEVRDTAVADAFLTKLGQGWATKTGVTAVTLSHQNATITHFPAQNLPDTLAFTRSGRLLLIGSNEAAIRQALDSQHSDPSLADQPAYQDAQAALPANRFLTLYLDSPRLRDTFASVPGISGVLSLMVTNPYTIVSSGPTAVGLSLVETGIQLDTVTGYNPATLSPLQQRMLAAQTRPHATLDIMPAETIFYTAGPSGQVYWDIYRQTLIDAAGDESSFNESMALFVRDFGLNPDTDLFPYLDGETAVALLPPQNSSAPTSLLSSLTSINLDAVLALGTSQQSQLEPTLQTLTTQLSLLQGSPITPTTENGFTLYTMALDANTQLTYGLGQNYLFLGTSQQAITNLPFSGPNSLADNPAYAQVAGHFPDTMSLAYYLDIPRLLDALAANPDLAQNSSFTTFRQGVQPIHYLAGAATQQDNSLRQRILIFIE